VTGHVLGGTPPVVREATTPDGLDALVLENEALRVTVLPAAGGHVSELVDLAVGRDVLWHNPRTAPRQAPYGAWFDDWWSGGWDEIFPSGDRGALHAERLPYMGELWCVPWTATVSGSGDEATITTSAFATIAPARFERRLTLRAGEPVLRVRYRIENLDVRPLPFTWGIHPAFAVSAAHRIDHPGSAMLVGVASDPTLGIAGHGYAWPSLPDASLASGLRDMRRVRPREDAVFGGHWATDLPEGWLAITDTAARRGVAIAFDTAVFPHAWLWLVYGGWRGHHHVALEPWTSHPMELEAAMEAGRARLLLPGEALETEVAVAVYGGLDAVMGIERGDDGFVVR
jgi:galactose mutarotase-like enzyme